MMRDKAPEGTKDRKRFNLEVSREVQTRVEIIQRETGAANITEVIRRALALYDAMHDARRERAKVILRYPDGTERELVIL